MTEFIGKNKKDLIKALFDKRSALQKFRFESAGGKSKNVKEGYALRKDIARILTEVQNQARAAAIEAPKAEVAAPKAEVKAPTKKAVKKVTSKKIK